jgi:hypothetical protein
MVDNFEDIRKDSDVDVIEHDDDYVIEFRRAYNWEGTQVNEIKLDLDVLTSRDIDILEAKYRREFKKTKGMAEIDNRFIKLIAERTSVYPYDFFDLMPAAEFAKLKGMILPFLIAAD